MKIFDGIAHFICLHYKKVLLVALMMLLVSGFFASRIIMKVHFADMLPAGIPQVAEFRRIITDFHSASSIFVGIEGEDKEELVRAAEEITPTLTQLDNVRRVDYRVNTDFIRRHGFLLQEEKDDLIDSLEIFSNLELLPLLRAMNDNFEDEVIGDEDRFATAEDELAAIRFLDGLVDFLSLEPDPEKVRQLLLGDEFFISPDREMLILQIQPTISIDDYHEAMTLAREVRGTVGNFAKDFPHLNMGTTGMMVLALEEMEGMAKGMGVSALVAIILILALLIISFKMWTSPLLAITTLICAIVYTAGFIGVTIGHINMLTAFFAVLLLGLGIDFAIHLTSGFTEARTKGMTLEDSIKTMYAKVGRGVVAGAVTTSLVFFTFTLTGMQVLIEMGIALGTGILITLISTLFILPALFCLQCKIKPSLLSSAVKAPQFIFLEKSGTFIMSHRWLVGSFAVVITVVLFLFARQITWQYDMMEMMPKGIPSIIMQERIIEKFEISPDTSLVTAKSVEEARKFKEAMERKSLVGGVESISRFIPPYDEQKNIRLPLIKEFKGYLKERDFNYVADERVVAELAVELERLKHNIMEIGELAYFGGQLRVTRKSDEIVESGALWDTIELLSVSTVSNFQKAYIPVMRDLLLQMTEGDIITLEKLPQEIKDRFINEEGDKFLVTIYSRECVWDEDILRIFKEQIYSVEPRTSGTVVFFVLLMDMIGERAQLATILAFFAILVVLAIDFKSIKLSFIAMVPIVSGAIWMVGIMQILGIKFDFSNIMAIPLILGIGIDDAIHIIHRYRIEGKIPIVLRTAGKAILLTSLTTMVGFGSLGFSPHRGLAGMGHVLAIGVAACFLTSVFVLPAILEKKSKFKKEFKGR